MKKYTTFEIIAFVSAIMSALISAILLGIVCSFMIVTKPVITDVHASATTVDAGRSHRMLESETFLCGEDRRVSIAINSTDRHPFEVTNALWSLMNSDKIEASGDCEVQAIRSDYTVLKAKIQPMIANNVYTLRFSYDVNDEHLEQDVTVRVK